MAAGDTTAITISADDTDAAIKTKVEAAFTVASTDIFLTANQGGQTRIIQIKGA